ncbi:unnamed protein product [Rangifer tarandus platyrhynchus]|uniref:Uncharacterized protein n=1 Tax=Rangifer tarandus platyrhynchus TaxID=3082113 RepID=A0ABN8ZJ81_RANTA|nr:unnamed protein product [Rangifer tarandus platyrhynchus]
MESLQASRQSTQAKTLETPQRSISLLRYFVLWAVFQEITLANPHHLVNMTWIVYNPEMGEILNSTNVAPKGTWWSVLTVDLCILAADNNGFHGPSQLSDFVGSPQFGPFGLFDWAFQGDTPCTKPVCLPRWGEGSEPNCKLWGS